MTHIVRSGVVGVHIVCVIMTHCVRKSICDSPLRKINYIKHEYRTIKYRNYKNFDPQKLSTSPQLYVMPVLNSVWLFLKDILSKSSNEHAPITNKHVKGRLYPGLKVEIKALINFKNQLHRKGRKSNKVTDWKICKKCQKRCNIMVKRAKKSI